MQPSDNQQPENWQQPATPPTEEFHPIVEPNVPDAPTPLVPQPSQPVQVEAPQPVTSEMQMEPNAAFDENPSVDDPDEVNDTGDEELIRWEAHEYIHHDRSALWYICLVIIVLALIAVAILLVKSITFAVLIPVMAIALVVYARRPPQAIQYILSRKGLHVNDKLLVYDTFRAFSIIQHEGHNSIILIPRKRFALAETIYFPDDAGETIVDMLAARLPMKDAKPDVFDRIITKLKL